MKNSMADKSLMTAFFSTREAAEQAYQELSDRGYRHNEISVLMSEATCSQFQTIKGQESAENKTAEDSLAADAPEQATPKAIIAALIAVGINIIMPGLALIVAGPLAAALVSANGISGGLAGALSGSGFPGEAARDYELGIRRGGIFLGFNPHNNRESGEIKNIWNAYNAELILSLTADF